MLQAVRRAFVEFLTIPSLVILGFLVLSVVVYFLDHSRMAFERGGSGARIGLFSDPQVTRDFLGVIAGSIITVTSITLSLLLIAVQQGAASLTSLVFDQFLRRRANQFYFGFFIGLALYSLVVLASISADHQPVYGVAISALMTIAALYMLLILIYTTIDQMRPVVIIKSIHDHALIARRSQRGLLRETRPPSPAAAGVPIVARSSGFLIGIDCAAITKAAGGGAVVILPSIGDFVALGDRLAEVSGHDDFAALENAVREALSLEDQRDLDTDPVFCVEQLATIGWTSISTAKSNPGPGGQAIWNLRDLLARWTDEDPAFGDDEAERDPAATIVYRDNLAERLMQAFESLAVVASESMQHQTITEVYRSLAILYPRLSPPLQRRTEDILMRSLSGLGDHVLTSDLDATLGALIVVLAGPGRSQYAEAIEEARVRLGRSIGQLNARSTRVEAG